MKPLQPVSPTARIVLGISFFVLFVAVWAAAIRLPCPAYIVDKNGFFTKHV